MKKEKTFIFLHISKKSSNFAAALVKYYDDYRFININQEPTEEQLAQLMHEVAVEAKERYEKAHAAYL